MIDVPTQCPICGSELIEIEKNNIYGCPNCKLTTYYRPVDNVEREEIKNKINKLREEINGYS